MSVEHLAVVLHHSRAKGATKLVLIGIANHDGDGGAWPSHATLARYANMHPDNVRKHVAQLVGMGELSVDIQTGGDRDCPESRRPNRYHVQVRCPAWCDRSPNHRDTRKLAGPQRELLPPPGGGAELPPQLSTGGAELPPGGGAELPPKPSIEPGTNQVGYVPPVRATPLDWRPCQVCSCEQAVCERRQTRLQPGDQHPYTPPTRPGASDGE